MRALSLLAAALLTLSLQNAMAADKSDDEVRQAIINESIAAYSGNCPCPYYSAINGSRCGKRSAYSNPSGASPYCYNDDVSDEMVEQWKARHQ